MHYVWDVIPDCAEYVPAEQGRHNVLFVAANVPEYVPAEQFVQSAAPSNEYVPAPQGAH
jgi:hypothetical protein